MHIVSTINSQTRSTEDVPVVLVTLDGTKKFLPRPESYEDMNELVRAHYKVDAHAALQFMVSTLDVCQGESVEVTEAAYPLLASLLDSVSVTVVPNGRVQAIPTPSATPPLHADDEVENDQEELDYLDEAETSRALVPKLESEDEEVIRGSQYGGADDPNTLFDDDEDEDDSDRAPPVIPKKEAKKPAKVRVTREEEDEDEEVPQQRTTKREAPSAKTEVKVKAEVKTRVSPSKASASHSPSKPRSAANRSQDAADSSQAPASEKDERFKVSITGPRPGQKAEFVTRGGHLVRKVLGGVCKTFNLDIDRAKLMLLVSVQGEEDDEIAYFECAQDDTVKQSGINPNSKLVVRVEDDEEGDEEEED
ncbi:Zn(2)-C6 fungal-type domain-containing protein [Favolaschia claudopus]|uniref:Zn(2)-C6 fungal-type domain-containing protein n=1 Tax=Favolaschia claudopus TaxID=2862362 RepID=A0AAW0CAA3_9AGAR